MKTALPFVLLLSVASPALANPDSVAPEGWDRSENRSLTVYQSNPRGEVMVFRTFENTSDIANGVEQFASTMTGNADRVVMARDRMSGPLYVQDIEYIQRGVTMQAQIVGVQQSGNSVLVMAYLAAKSAPNLNQRMEGAKQRMAALADPDANASAASSSAPAARPAPRAVVSTPASGQSAQRVMFELKYSYGVGGAVYPTYDLVALLDGGTAAKLGSYAVDAVDVGAIRRAKATDVGTWRNSGRNVQVRWSDGDTSELKPTVGPPTALPASRFLSGTYQAIGGGGNTALGGQVLTAQVKQFTFRSNGTFSQSSSKSASSASAAARSISGSSTGRWTLEGSTLTLRYGDGRTVRTSVFYSGSAKPRGKFGRYGVLWIGGEDYKRVR